MKFQHDVKQSLLGSKSQRINLDIVTSTGMDSYLNMTKGSDTARVAINVNPTVPVNLEMRPKKHQW